MEPIQCRELAGVSGREKEGHSTCLICGANIAYKQHVELGTAQVGTMGEETLRKESAVLGSDRPRASEGVPCPRVLLAMLGKALTVKTRNRGGCCLVDFR